MELDTDRKYYVLGTDEKVWYFMHSYEDGVASWRAFRGLLGLYTSEGMWPQTSILRFLTKHQHKLTDDDQINLWLFLYRGAWQKQIDRTEKKLVPTNLPNP